MIASSDEAVPRVPDWPSAAHALGSPSRPDHRPTKAGLVPEPAAVSVDALDGLDVEWSTEPRPAPCQPQPGLARVDGIGVSVYQPRSGLQRSATQARVTR